MSYVTYLAQFFYPAGLAVFYPHPLASLSPGLVAGAALVLVAVSAAAVACRRRCPYFFVGWLWYLGMLVPVIGFTQAGPQGRADRFSYLPQIGLYLALVWGAVGLCRWWASRRWLGSITSVVVLALLTGCAWRQTCFWRDSIVLWQHTLACTSRNCLAHENLGYAYAEREQWDAAIAQYRRALEIHPGYSLAYDGMGAAFMAQDHLDQAMAYLRWP